MNIVLSIFLMCSAFTSFVLYEQLDASENRIQKVYFYGSKYKDAEIKGMSICKVYGGDFKQIIYTKLTKDTFWEESVACDTDLGDGHHRVRKYKINQGY